MFTFFTMQTNDFPLAADTIYSMEKNLKAKFHLIIVEISKSEWNLEFISRT